MIRAARRVLAVACALGLLLSSSSCFVHEHRFGVGAVGVGSSSARQYYLLFGLVRLNDVDAQRLAAGKTSYAVRTSFTWWDFVLAPFLLPVTMSSRSVTVQW